MTKTELRQALRSGQLLCDLIPLRSGQDCEIFKTDAFQPGSDIIYIPDIALNDLPAFGEVLNEEEIEEVIGCCYTGDDFIEECDGDVELAERLFWYCDWQHPSSALPEVDDREEE